MFGFTSLEEKLLAPDGGQELSRVNTALGDIAGALREGVAAGLSNADFAQASAILAAVSASERILTSAPLEKGASQ